ncbi:MAG: MBL fold metallo-hydrolase [Candidatus Verstraetearchaeota archaeon]|nr:MBL fold metallo-hydrolase [Candidatus Verstraetearchaeota archaeon]
MLFKQIKHSGDNFSYVVADDNTKEAAVVDPGFNVDRIIQFLKDNGLKAKYVIATHHHGDHTAGNEKIKAFSGAAIVAHRLSSIEKDIEVADGDVLEVGGLCIRVIHTPGHTRDGISLLVDGKLLTGDTLFVGECGRTDLSDSSAEDMHDSLFDKLMRLDNGVEVYPGHDYGPRPFSTIGAERRSNYTLKRRSLEEFVEFMKEP